MYLVSISSLYDFFLRSLRHWKRGVHVRAEAGSIYWKSQRFSLCEE